jgi:hypothetical protein
MLLVPDQAPPALQELTLVPVQVSLTLPPLLTTVGFAVNARLGAVDDPTVTVAEAVVDPPVPVHVNVYVRVDVIELSVWVPDVALDPDHALDAEQLSAYREAHVSVDEPPLTTVFGEAESETVGVGEAFVGFVLFDVDP